jgi:3-methyladenine DNA glycosylase AlkC
MADALKDSLYSPVFIDELGKVLAAVYPAFDQARYHQHIYDSAWADRALKQRTRHITTVVHDLLPTDYRDALGILRAAATGLAHHSYAPIFMPDFVEVYGLEDWEASLPALAWFTRFSSSEFAVRPFILRDPPRMMAQMLTWATDSNHHVRRLASEGCRPRLPWGMALAPFKQNPAPILPILEQLKDDPEDYVRRSVANNLNDIAKDNPAVVIDLLRRWQEGASPERQWIIKHALRTLLKQGHSDALGLLGYGDGAGVIVRDFTLDSTTVTMGADIIFHFTLESTSPVAQDVMLDYVVYYHKANGKQAPKVFKLSAFQLGAGESRRFERRLSFRPISTRVYYPGPHRITLQINGVEQGEVVFDLTGT